MQTTSIIHWTFRIFTALTLPLMVSNCSSKTGLEVMKGSKGESLIIQHRKTGRPVLVQNARPNMRPYLHPIMAPDGNGELTQFSPGHHLHQTGLYWGFTRVNGTGAPPDTLRKWFYNRNKPARIKEQIGRDFFHFNGGSHWSRQTLEIIRAEGPEVNWKTVYHLLDATAHPILEETMFWSCRTTDKQTIITLTWQGKALEPFTVNAFSYGGMFLRMPWQEGIAGTATNSAGQTDQEAEGQKAKWVDIGMAIDGRPDWGHLAILDHPENNSFPTPWRVDGQLGVGPCRAIEGDWHIPKGQTETIRRRIIAHTGSFSPPVVEEWWRAYSIE